MLACLFFSVQINVPFLIESKVASGDQAERLLIVPKFLDHLV